MERSGYEDFEAGVVRENRGLRMMSLTRGRGRGGRGGEQASVSSETTAQDVILSYCNCM